MDIRISYAETVAGNLMKLISVPESRDPPNKMTVLALICLAAVVATDALPSLNLSAGHPKHPDVIMDGKHSGSAQLPV